MATKKQAKKKFGDKDSRIKSCRALSLLWPLESHFISEQSATTFLVEYFVEIFSLVRSVLIRRNQFNLLVYASDRPYFSKKKKIILQNFDILNFFKIFSLQLITKTNKNLSYQKRPPEVFRKKYALKNLETSQ